MKRRKGKVRNKDPILLIGQIDLNKQSIQLVYFNKLIDNVIIKYNKQERWINKTRSISINQQFKNYRYEKTIIDCSGNFCCC